MNNPDAMPSEVLPCTLLARRNKLVSCNLRSVPLDNRTETAKSKEHRFRAVLRAPTLRLTIDGQKRSWPLFFFSVVDTVAHRPADAVCVVAAESCHCLNGLDRAALPYDRCRQQRRRKRGTWSDSSRSMLLLSLGTASSSTVLLG